MLPQEEGKNYMVLGNSFMIAFPPTFDFDKDQITFRVNPNAPPHTEINVIDTKSSKSKWKFAVYFLAIFFLILLVAGILIATLQKNKRKNQHVYHKQRRA